MEINFNITAPFEPLFKGELSSKRLIIYYGGRGGSKTDQITQWLILKALTEKNVNFLVGREVEKSNMQSLLLNFKLWLRVLNLDKYFVDKKNALFQIKGKVIKCVTSGVEIIFSGVNRNVIFNLKSVPNLKLCWIEEASYLSEDVYRILVPTIRANNSQIILTLNPQNETDFVWAELIKKNLDDDTKFIRRVNYDENPFFPPVLELERQRDLKNLPKDLYLHIWEGEPLNYNEMQVIDTTKIGRFDDTNKLKGKYLKIIIVIDSAFSTKASADYSVVSCFGKINNEIHLLRLERGHWDFNTLIEMLKSLYFWTSENYGNVNQILIEKKASGQSLIQEISRLTTFQIKAVVPTTDKFTRLTEVISHLDSVKLPMSDNALNYWINDFLKECKEFRADLKHAHDDQVDCLIYALKELQFNTINWDLLAKKIS